MARRRSTRRRTTSRRSGRRRSRSTSGMALAPMLVGGTLGSLSAAGAGGTLNWLANKLQLDLPPMVRDGLPLAGAALVSGITAISKKTRGYAIPTLIGGVIAAVTIYGFKYASGAGNVRRRLAAGAYNRLKGSGNATRVLNASAGGAGNATRVLNAA